MKRKVQLMLSKDGQQALDQYRQELQQVEGLSPMTIHNYLSDLRQFIAWCENSWSEGQEDRLFTPQAVIPTLLIRYRERFRISLCLKPSTANRTLMSLKRYFAWIRKKHHRFGYRMAEVVPLHRLTQIMDHDSLDTTMLYVCGTKQDLQQNVEKIAWI